MSGDNPDGGRNVVFVLGMHRSGTSALSRILSLLGCDLPKTLMPESPDNARGYWESLPVTHLNDAVLASGGSHWDDWLPFNPNWYDSPVYSNFVERGRNVLRDEFDASPLFVLKDPRCARLVPYWTDVFKREAIVPLVVIPIRNPIEVAESITNRDHIHRDVVLLVWLRHVLDAERDTRGLARAFATYDALMANWTALALQLQDRLGIRWPGLSALTGVKVDGFLDPGIRHYSASPDNVLMNPLLAGWLRETFAIMLRWASDGESADDFKALDAIKRDFDAAGPAFSGITQALSDRVDQAQDLEASLADRLTEISDLSLEVSSLRAAWVATRDELAAKEAQIRTETEQRSGLDEDALAEFEAEAEALREQLGRAEQTLREREEEITRADRAKQSAVQRAESVAEALDAEAKALRDRLIQVHRTLREREEEIRRVGSEKAEISDRADALEAEKREIEARLHDADEAVRGHHDALRANEHAAQRASAEMQDLRDRLAYVESTLRQREEEIAQAGVENGSVKDRIELLEAEKRKIEAKLADADKWVFRLAEERQKAHAQIALIDADMQEKDRALKVAHRQIEHAHARYRALEEQVAREHAQFEADTQRLAAENLEANIPEIRPVEVDDRADERVDEIATLSHMLLEQNGKVETLANGHLALESLAEDRLQEIERLRTIVRELGDATDHRNLEQSGKVEILAAGHAAWESLAENRLAEIQRLRTTVREIGEASDHKDREQDRKVETLADGHAAWESLAEDRLQEIERLRAIVRDIGEAGERKDREIRDTAQSTAAEQAGVGRYVNELAALSGMLLEQQALAEELGAERLVAERLAHDRLSEVEQWKSAANDRLSEVEQWKSAAHGAQDILARKDAELEELRRASVASDQRAQKTVAEIAALSSMLVEQQRQAEQNTWQTEWMQQVMMVMMRTRWWHKFAPTDWVNDRKYRALQRKGLFDSDAYVSRYPDVKDTGVSPLQHFILHGMAEHRIGLPAQLP